jgi:3-oxoadipate enol-lactonase
MHIKANGITFNYQIDGAQDAPWLIFSNSLATNLSMWDEQTRALSGLFRILRYDQRGHGKTEEPEGRYPFAILLADAIALMDALEIRSAHFCGLSLGGATALGLAEQYPDRIDRVIICDSPCASTPTSAKQWEERIVMAKGGCMAAIAEPTLQRWFPPDVYAANPPGVVKVRGMVLSTPLNGFIGCCAALADHDFRSAVANVSRPVLFLVGEKDPPNAAMREMHKELNGSQFVEIAGAGHICNIERPEMFTNALEKFLMQPTSSGQSGSL